MIYLLVLERVCMNLYLTRPGSTLLRERLSILQQGRARSGQIHQFSDPARSQVGPNTHFSFTQDWVSSECCPSRTMPLQWHCLPMARPSHARTHAGPRRRHASASERQHATRGWQRRYMYTRGTHCMSRALGHRHFSVYAADCALGAVSFSRR